MGTTKARGRAPLLLALVAAMVGGVAQAQVRPPEVSTLSRYGMPAGAELDVTVSGVNLHEAREVITDAPGVSVTITDRRDRGPIANGRDQGTTGAPITDHGRRSEVVLRLAARAESLPGVYRLRVRTPLGATPAVPFVLGAWPERLEAEAKGLLDIPSVINGAIADDGEVDSYRFVVPAGTELVAAVMAAPLGSRLDSLLLLRGPDGGVIARNDDGPDGSRDSLIVHTTTAAGTYTVEVSDAGGLGSDRGHYRLTVGAVPLITHVFPLGGRAGAVLPVRLAGANVPAELRLPALRPEPNRPEATRMVPLASLGASLPPLVSRTLLPAGSHPDILEAEDETATPPGQLLGWPVTVNGRIAPRADGTSADHYAIDVAAGERLTMTVLAERAGSPLDSVVEVLDAEGRPVPSVLLRPVWETAVGPDDRDSRGGGMRLLSTAGLRRGDYVLVDREVMRVRELPKSPDEDVVFMDAMGRRLSYFGTSGESHAPGRPVYKVEVHPPDATPSPNGMPLVPLTYRNDDGGPFYGRDSTLTFEAPAAGRYVIRLTDSRGMADERFAYRLTVAPPQPDFLLSLDTTGPNVPAGGRVPVTVSAIRFDGFDGPIAVRLEGLDGPLRSAPGTVLPGEHSVTLFIEAAEAAAMAGMPFRVMGEARIGAQRVRRMADTSRALPLVSVTRGADVSIASVEPSEVRLAPGERATVTVRVARHNGFTGRVPLAVRNLPFLTTVADTGVNGILITEQQSERQFVIEADPGAPDLEQQVIVTARWEVDSSGSTEQAALPITLRVVGSRPEQTLLPAPPPAAWEPTTPEESSAELLADAADAWGGDADPVPVAANPAQATTANAGAARARPWWGWVLLGRLHPTVVHFPIALILAGALFEVLQVARRRRVPSEVGTYCLTLGLVGGVVAAWLGTLNADHQNLTGASADLLERHRYAGWALVGVAAAALLAGRMLRAGASTGRRVAYAVLLAGSVGLVSAAGHFGGQLVYGEEYLTGVLPWNQEESPGAPEDAPAVAQMPPAQDTAPDADSPVSSPQQQPSEARTAGTADDDDTAPRQRTPASAASAAPPAARPAPGPAAPPASAASPAPSPAAPARVDFNAAVEPIFRETCVECHGPDKVRARLRMDSVAHLQKGGKSGPMIIPGDPDASPLLRRVLGLDGEDRMPLDKDPLTDEQIETLRRWLAEGAPFGAASPTSP